MEYILTDNEKAFVQTLRNAVIQARVVVRDTQLAVKPAESALAAAQDNVKKAEAQEAQIQAQFDGALKLLLNAHAIATGALSADCSKIVAQ